MQYNGHNTVSSKKGYGIGREDLGLRKKKFRWQIGMGTSYIYIYAVMKVQYSTVQIQCKKVIILKLKEGWPLQTKSNSSFFTYSSIQYLFKENSTLDFLSYYKGNKASMNYETDTMVCLFTTPSIPPWMTLTIL